MNSQQAAPQAAPAKAAQQPNAAELRDQIKQTILAARE